MITCSSISSSSSFSESLFFRLDFFYTFLWFKVILGLLFGMFFYYYYFANEIVFVPFFCFCLFVRYCFGLLLFLPQGLCKNLAQEFTWNQGEGWGSEHGRTCRFLGIVENIFFSFRSLPFYSNFLEVFSFNVHDFFF